MKICLLLPRRLAGRYKFLGWTLGCGLVLLVAGCKVAQNTAELPGRTVGMVANAGKPKEPKVDPVEVQQTVLRFADEFATAMVMGVDKLRCGTNELDPAETLRWKLALSSESSAIASGPNTMANLLDMTVMVTLVRMTLEDYWQPQVFKDSAQPILDSSRRLETVIWQYTKKVLTPSQQKELRLAIENYRRQNPQPEGVLGARAVSFASQMASANRTAVVGLESVFNLIRVDPLAGLDPAVREIAQTRMFAERTLYVTQKLPLLLRWQAELLSINAIQQPAVQQLVTNAAKITSSVETFARVADQLPQLINDQRTAAIKQVFAELANERTNLISNLAADDLKLRASLVELRQTLTAGQNLMATSDDAIKSLDKLMARFESKHDSAPATATPARPFDILDYAATAKEMTRTIQELNIALNSVDKATQQIEKAGDHFLNRFFLIGAGLIVLLLCGALLTIFLYRRMAITG